MALAVANSWQNHSTGLVTTLAITVSGIQAGDLLIAVGAAFANDTDLVFDTTTDNGGNTWSAARAQSAHTATFRSWCAIMDTVVVTPPTTVTVATTGNTELSGAVIHVTGNQASPFDQANQNTQTADDPTSASVTTTVADEILVAAITQDAVGDYTSVASFIIQQELEGSGFTDFAAATRIVSATGTYSAAWTTGGSADYGMAIASYTGVASGPDTGLAWIRA